MLVDFKNAPAAKRRRPDKYKVFTEKFRQLFSDCEFQESKSGARIMIAEKDETMESVMTSPEIKETAPRVGKKRLASKASISPEEKK